MNANDYKRNKDNPAVFDFDTLVSTARILDEAKQTDLAANIRAVLVKDSLSKPALHNLPNEQFTSFYLINFPVQEIEKIIEILVDFEVNALTENYETTPVASHYASILDKWNALISD